MKTGVVVLAIWVLCIQPAAQQSSDEVVLDRDGISLADFEVQVQSLASQIFIDLASATQDTLQDVAATFSRNLGLSVANVVIYTNNQGITDIESQAQEIAVAVESAFSSAVAAAGPAYQSFDIAGITSTVQTSVTDVLTQLSQGTNINDVVNPVANSVLQAAFNAIIQLLSAQAQAASAAPAPAPAPMEPAAAEDEPEIPETVATGTTEPVVEPAAAVGTGSGTSSGSARGAFSFSAEGLTVESLRQELTTQAEAGFTKIETEDPTEMAAAIQGLAVNLTQIIGNGLLTVLNAGEDVDKETEAEAISDAVRTALTAAVESAQGNLQSLDVDQIEEEVLAATFTAITAIEESEEDVNTILQTAAESILATVANALGNALNVEVSGEVQINYTTQGVEPPNSVEVVPTETVKTTNTTTTTVGGTAIVSGSALATVDQIQANLSQAFTSTFSAVEEDPSAASTQQSIQDLILGVSSAIGAAVLSLQSQGQPDEQVQVVVELFQDALETAIAQAGGPVGDFDIAGVMEAIEAAATQVFTQPADASIDEQVQNLASQIIDILVEQLTEVLPGFTFTGSVEVTGTTTEITIPVQESVTTITTTPVRSEGSFSIQSTSSTTVVEAPPTPVELPTEGECLCLDEVQLNSIIDARVEQRVMEILQQNNILP
eukprot:TRINITY_DN17787_c0_g1_i2.p1 TRINITY_DN17787_c0_g1~~TRINITY_DN17787_c0_g1_i2.p1  ORF type:complete len:690 (-),score=115.17 TRINITY_DN17787_c0_g1_i2:1225-3210(-)